MTDFHVGDCYFRLSFLDAAMNHPVIETLVFIGMNLSTEDKADSWYFQDAHSYHADGPAHESALQHGQVFCYGQDDARQLLDLGGLGLEIAAAANRRGQQSI